MTTGAKLLEGIAARRKAVFEMILKEPERFCVCEGCSSILIAPIKTYCTYCRAYRFDYSREGVLAMARISGEKPFAGGCPVIPRYAAQINQA